MTVDRSAIADLGGQFSAGLNIGCTVIALVQRDYLRAGASALFALLCLAILSLLPRLRAMADANLRAAAMQQQMAEGMLADIERARSEMRVHVSVAPQQRPN